MQFLRQLFDGNERDIAKYRKEVEKVNALEPEHDAAPRRCCSHRPGELDDGSDRTAHLAAVAEIDDRYPSVRFADAA